MIKLAILASGNGTNAQAILEAVQSGEMQADVKVVLTNKPQAGVIARASKFGVPVEVIPSKGILFSSIIYYFILLVKMKSWFLYN